MGTRDATYVRTWRYAGIRICAYGDGTRDGRSHQGRGGPSTMAGHGNRRWGGGLVAFLVDHALLQGSELFGCHGSEFCQCQTWRVFVAAVGFALIADRETEAV